MKTGGVIGLGTIGGGVAICLQRAGQLAAIYDVNAAAADRIAQDFGRLDVLMNNAGLGGEVDLVDMTDEQRAVAESHVDAYVSFTVFLGH